MEEEEEQTSRAGCTRPKSPADQKAQARCLSRCLFLEVITGSNSGANKSWECGINRTPELKFTPTEKPM